MKKKKYHSCTWRSVHPPVCPPARPTNSSSHFCPKNSVCHWQKALTPQVFVMKMNHRDPLPSGPRLQWTFSLRPCEWGSQTASSLKNVTLSLSMMFGGAGSQSQHIKTAFISLETVRRFRLGGGGWGHWGNTLKTLQCTQKCFLLPEDKLGMFSLSENWWKSKRKSNNAAD